MQDLIGARRAPVISKVEQEEPLQLQARQFCCETFRLLSSGIRTFLAQVKGTMPPEAPQAGAPSQ